VFARNGNTAETTGSIGLSMKKIAVLCLGTRGDIQPYIALAQALRRRDVAVRLAAPRNFERFIQDHGVEYAPVEMDTSEGLRSKEGQIWLSSGNTLAFLRHLNKLIKRDQAAIHKGFFDAVQDADAILATVMTLGEGLTLAEKRNIPVIASLTFPLFPESTQFPNLFVSSKDLALGSFNLLAHRIFDVIGWRSIRDSLNAWRLSMGLTAWKKPPSYWIRQKEVLTLHHYSPTLFRRPGDWPAHHALTGPLFLEGNQEDEPAVDPLSAELTEFLAQPRKPVFLGFGSMPILDAGRVLEMTSRVIQKLGIRVVIGAGWSEFQNADLPSDIYLMAAGDHNRVFPECQALVHHGGAGTTFTGLRWGKPAVVFSVFADQPFWGEQLQRAGVGVHFRYKHFSEDLLTKGLQTVLDPAMQDRAGHLGEQLRREAGADRSADLIVSHLNAVKR
jgi:sterol 3beta-glucosyltransferase